MTDVLTTCAVVIFRVKVSCMTSVDGEIQTSGGDGSLVQLSVDGHAILLKQKW